MKSYSAQIIRSLRKTLAINQVELSKQLGISQGAVSKVENGLLELHALEWITFCDAYSIDPNNLTCGFVTFLPKLKIKKVKKLYQVGSYKVPERFLDGDQMTLASLFPILKNLLSKSEQDFAQFLVEFKESFQMDSDYLFVLDHPINQHFLDIFFELKAVESAKFDFASEENFKYYRSPRNLKSVLKLHFNENIEQAIDMYIKHYASVVFRNQKYVHDSINKRLEILSHNGSDHSKTHNYQVQLLLDFMASKNFEMRAQVKELREGDYRTQVLYA